MQQLAAGAREAFFSWLVGPGVSTAVTFSHCLHVSLRFYLLPPHRTWSSPGALPGVLTSRF